MGHLLCALPYLLFWDYTDEKHEKVIKVLAKREQLALAGATQEEIYAVTMDDVVTEPAAAEAPEKTT